MTILPFSEPGLFVDFFMGWAQEVCLVFLCWILKRVCDFVQRGTGGGMMVAMDLQEFIVRARVLKLYRQALRITRKAPENSRAELRQTIREEMEKNRNCKDRQRIRFFISKGLQRLKGLEEMLDMQGH